jgi:hypothetical protein
VHFQRRDVEARLPEKTAAPMIENRLLRTAALKAAHPTAS